VSRRQQQSRVLYCGGGGGKCTRLRAQEAAEAWRLNADAQVSAI